MRARTRPIAAVLWLATAAAGCSRSPAPLNTPPAATRAVLDGIGIRLSRTHSADELTRIAARGDLLVPLLTRGEREALGRCGLGFTVDRPAVVDVVAPRASAPFWLADRGFVDTGMTARRDGLELAIYRRAFEAGRVELGVNALDRRAEVHYAAIVRSRDGGPVAVRDFDPDLARPTPVANGDGPSFDLTIPFDSLPTSYLGATLIRTSHARRHDALLTTGRVWKSHVVSSRRPDQVVVTPGADASRSLTWTWRTGPEFSATALRIARASAGAPDRADPATIRVERGDSTAVRVDGLLNDPLVRRHRAAVEGLEPCTNYVYSAGDGNSDGWLPWRPIRTAPGPGRDLKILYAGDAQCGLEGWGKLMHAAAARHADAAMLLMAGDLVDRGNERSNWDHFFLRAAGVFDAVPLVPAVGNHEYLDQGPRLFRAFFAPPRNGPSGHPGGLAYGITAGDAFLAVLDSTAAVFDPANARLQADWLDAALRSTPARWRIVMFHHPIYASHPERDQARLLREHWVPVLDAHRVDMVLQGHDHAYMRSYPMRGGVRAEGGTTYVVAVSGDKFCGQRSRDDAAVGFTEMSTYQVLDFQAEPPRLTYRAYDLAGRRLDEWVVAKPAPQLASRLPRE